MAHNYFFKSKFILIIALKRPETKSPFDKNVNDVIQLLSLWVFIICFNVNISLFVKKSK